MDVLVAAEEPVRSALEAGLSDADVTVRDGEAGAVADARFAVVAGVAGADRFDRAADAAAAGETPWVSIEIGGVGGSPIEGVDAAITGYAPGGPCYRCLQSRVAAAGVEPAESARGERRSARLAGAVAAHECVSLFAGAEPAITGHVLELPHARRRLLPVPTCDCAPERDRSLGRDDQTLGLDAVVERCEAVIDDRVGLVTQLGEVSSFPAPYYLATMAETGPLSDASGPTEAAGVDDDWNAALVRAVGEGLERYCAATYREADFAFGPANDDPERVPPERFVRPADQSGDRTTPIHWVPGEALDTRDSVSLPASAVHFPPPSPRVVPAITTGLGLGTSTVDALVAGLTEIIERDAAMLAWYSGYEPVALETDDETVATLERRARGEGLAVTLLGLTQDVDVPVVGAAVHRSLEADADWPAIAFGSAAGLDGEAAAADALAEALQNWMELRDLGPETAAERAGGAIASYAADPTPLRSFVAAETTVPAAALGPDPVPTGQERLEQLVDAVTDAGLEPYATGLTTPDVGSLDFAAVRVLVPGAQPLFTGDPFFGDRARTVPETLGYEPSLEADYHPFP